MNVFDALSFDDYAPVTAPGDGRVTTLGGDLEVIARGDGTFTVRATNPDEWDEEVTPPVFATAAAALDEAQRWEDEFDAQRRADEAEHYEAFFAYERTVGGR